ncbi:MAG: dethiobiotin synthase [Gaiellaceae bacterium]
MNGHGYFVTATDTGVGKTVVTAALASLLRARGRDVAVFKPVQSGALADDPAGDAAILGAECVYSFAAPLAPLVAARAEGVTIGLEPILTRAQQLAAKHELLLVEGAGGLLVPLAPGLDIADLAVSLGLPLIVVARAGLGTVNHTLLTIEAARARGLEIAAVVLNGESDESTADNAALIEADSGARVLAHIPRLADPTDAAGYLDDLLG